MSIAPVNFYSSYGLVPIFQWVPVAPTQDSTTDTPPTFVVCQSTGVGRPPQPTDTDTPASQQMRLVFKGFEWRAVAEIATFPRPDWMSGVASGCDEEADLSNKQEDRNKRLDEAARARRAALAHSQPDPASSQDPGPAATDTSDSD